MRKTVETLQLILDWLVREFQVEVTSQQAHGQVTGPSHIAMASVRFPNNGSPNLIQMIKLGD
jgi:hypothetical protein